MTPWGITANMLVCRCVFETVGGFGPVPLPGGDLRAEGAVL
jgi:hypothetical protein